MIRVTVATPEEMAEFGARLAAHLHAGDVVALNGELGAGKTTLTRGIGEALVVRGAVTSPTFVLARTHPTASGIPFVHVDAYRLGSAVELDDLDIDFAHSIVVVEWAAGMLDAVADEWLTIDIARPTRARDVSDDAGIEPRAVTITGTGDRWSDLSWLETTSGGDVRVARD